MEFVDRSSSLWKYFTPDFKAIVEDGEILIRNVDSERERIGITDFSFLVFPFAKAYEGFIKKLLLDLKAIKPDEYYGDEIRVGRLLNPDYKREDGGSVFTDLCKHSPERKTLAHGLWEVWKKGRNQVFHYFPHNFRKLSYEEAVGLIKDFVTVMKEAVDHYNLHHKDKGEK